MTRTMHRTSGRGFTLVELIVVMGITVLVLALAVPLFGVFTGSRSIEGAQNQVSAVMNNARSSAMAMQQYVGVMFYRDGMSDAVVAQLVTAPDGLERDASGEVAFLDLYGSEERLTLPPGVSLQTLADAFQGGSQADRYLGYNTVGATVQYAPRLGGVVLFDPQGQLASVRYGLKLRQTLAANSAQTEMAKLLYGGSAHPSRWMPASSVTLRSQIGVALFGREPFANRQYDDGDRAFSQTTGDENAEETWLDENSIPLLVNRYNGTLIKGE